MAGLGRALLATGKLTEAVDSCQMAIRAGQNDVRAWQLLGEAYQARGAYVAALNAYKMCVELDRNCIYAQYQIAVVNSQLGFLSEVCLLRTHHVFYRPMRTPDACALMCPSSTCSTDPYPSSTCSTDVRVPDACAPSCLSNAQCTKELAHIDFYFVCACGGQLGHRMLRDDPQTAAQVSTGPFWAS